MSENNGEKPQPQEIRVTVDNEQTKLLAKELARAELENDRLKMEAGIKGKGMSDEEKLAKAEAERIAFQDAKLGFAEKTGDDSFKEVKSKEELKTKLDELLKLGAQQANKHGDLAGSAPMNPAQYGQQQGTGDLRKLPMNLQTITFLQNERRKGNTTASQILDELWVKSVRDWRSTGHQSTEVNIDNAVPKTAGTPELNFDNLKNVSEESGFPQIKKSPFNYSKTHQLVTGEPKE